MRILYPLLHNYGLHNRCHLDGFPMEQDNKYCFNVATLGVYTYLGDGVGMMAELLG